MRVYEATIVPWSMLEQIYFLHPFTFEHNYRPGYHYSSRQSSYEKVNYIWCRSKVKGLLISGYVDSFMEDEKLLAHLIAVQYVTELYSGEE